MTYTDMIICDIFGGLSCMETLRVRSTDCRGPILLLLRVLAAVRHQVFHFSRPGPTRPIIFSKVSARPGPAYHMGARPIRTWALYGPARQLRRPARGFDGPVNGPAHVLSRTKRRMSIRCAFSCCFFVVFPRLCSMGQLLSAHETRITSTHYSHHYAQQPTRWDGFLWTTSSCSCCIARSNRGSSSSSSTCCCNTRCFYNTPFRAAATPSIEQR